MQFLTHQILNMGQKVFLEEMLNIVFTEDIPFHVSVFMSRVNVFEIGRVVFINELKEAVELGVLVLGGIGAHLKLNCDEVKTLCFFDEKPSILVQQSRKRTLEDALCRIEIAEYVNLFLSKFSRFSGDIAPALVLFQNPSF